MTGAIWTSATRHQMKRDEWSCRDGSGGARVSLSIMLVLYCIVLYCIVFYSILLYSTLLYCIVLSSSSTLGVGVRHTRCTWQCSALATTKARRRAGHFRRQQKLKTKNQKKKEEEEEEEEEGYGPGRPEKFRRLLCVCVCVCVRSA